MRLGKLFDGGYVIADLSGTYDLFLSAGVADDISFELDLLRRYPTLETHAFDGSVEGLPADASGSIIQFHKEYVEAGTLDSFFENKHDIFLKMDIEGHEYKVLLSLVPNLISKVKQLVLEVHTPVHIEAFPEWYKGLQDIHYGYLLEIFSKLSATHTLIHVHANNGCSTHIFDNTIIPDVFECTFIRNDYIETKEVNTSPLPTPLDMRNNINCPDYYIDWPPFVFKKA